MLLMLREGQTLKGWRRMAINNTKERIMQLFSVALVLCCSAFLSSICSSSILFLAFLVMLLDLENKNVHSL